MSSYSNVFSPALVTVPFPQLLQLTLSANNTLIWPTAYQNTGNVVSQNNYISPTNNGFTLTLPQVAIAASGPVPAQPYVGVGESFFIANPTAFSFTLSTFAGGQTFNIASGAFLYFVLLQNTTSDGVWATGFSSGVSSVTSIGAAIATGALGNLTVSSSSSNPIISSGTFTFGLANDLLALISFGSSTGFAARTAANTWSTRALTGTTNQINISNPQGIAGNPVFSLNSNVTISTSLTAGNLILSGNAISTTNSTRISLDPPAGDQNVEIVSGNLVIDNGFGTVYTGTAGTTTILAGSQSVNITYILPTTAPVAGQVWGYSGANQTQWVTVPSFPGVTTQNAIAKYANNTGSLANSGVLIDGSENVSGAQSYQSLNLQIGSTTGSNPGNNSIISTNTNGAIILQPNGSGEVISIPNFDISNGGKLKIFPTGQSALTSLIWLSLAAPSGLPSQLNFTLPSADAVTVNAPLISNGSGVFSFNNIAYVTVSFALTNSQIQGMFAAGFPLIGAPGANNFLQVLSAVFVYSYTAPAFTGGGALQLQYTNAGNNAGRNCLTSTVASTFLTNTSSSTYKYNGADLVGVTGISNVGIFLTNATGAFVSGPAGNPVYIQITYAIVPGTI